MNSPSIMIVTCVNLVLLSAAVFCCEDKLELSLLTEHCCQFETKMPESTKLSVSHSHMKNTGFFSEFGLTMLPAAGEGVLRLFT